jgi:uncharacterized phage protein (TIGR02220 family)
MEQWGRRMQDEKKKQGQAGTGRDLQGKKEDAGKDAGVPEEVQKKANDEARDLYKKAAGMVGAYVADKAIIRAMKRIIKNHESGKESKPATIEIIRELIRFFNSETKGAISESSETTIVLLRRLLKAYSPSDIRNVIAFKNRQWKGNPEMSKYLRPQTLFSTKFEGYLSEWSRKQMQGGSGQGCPRTQSWRLEAAWEKFERIKRERDEGKIPYAYELRIDIASGKPWGYTFDSDGKIKWIEPK